MCHAAGFVWATWRSGWASTFREMHETTRETDVQKRRDSRHLRHTRQDSHVRNTAAGQSSLTSCYRQTHLWTESLPEIMRNRWEQTSAKAAQSKAFDIFKIAFISCIRIQICIKKVIDNRFVERYLKSKYSGFPQGWIVQRCKRLIQASTNLWPFKLYCAVEILFNLEGSIRVDAICADVV